VLAPPLLLDGPADASHTVALAPGAVPPMDSPFMTAVAKGLAAAGLRVARFEFPYMQARRATGVRRPPDRLAVLLDTWRAVVAALANEAPSGHGGTPVIGGKSLGGRVASMIADEVGARGLVCLGYPFHAPGKPPGERIAHLATLKTPTLIVQGSRDPFGTPEEVAGYALSPSVRVVWIDDGDHSFAPRGASDRTADDTWREAVGVTADFVRGL
jgi:hypothetical protein